MGWSWLVADRALARGLARVWCAPDICWCWTVGLMLGFSGHQNLEGKPKKYVHEIYTLDRKNHETNAYGPLLLTFVSAA